MKQLTVKLSFGFVLLFALCFFAKAQGTDTKEIKLVGQIVCSVCWFEDDRKKVPYGTEEDIACAKRCAKSGIPSALAVTDEKGDTKLYILEKGKFALKEKNWGDLSGQRVEISGGTRDEKDKLFVKVDALSFLEQADEKPIISNEVELVLKDLSGVEQRLSAYRGRVVVLNFWATWCVPCKEEMPDLAKIQNEYAALGVQVIGATADAQDERAKVLQFIQKNKINFPVWLGATTDNMKAFHLGQTLPATVIIGRAGKIVYQIKGIIKPKELRSHLDKLLTVNVAENDTKEQKRSSAVPA